MNYSQSLDYLNSFYNLEKMMASGQTRNWKLARMRRLLALFGHPQRSFETVLIAGTKGKGSTGFFLQAILNEAGRTAGFYSSPHLETPRERIRIRGKIISRNLWVHLLTGIRKKLQKNSSNKLFRFNENKMGQPSYFEIMTLMAALAFKELGMEIGVFEAGMGGRFDATNTLGAKRVVLTPIGLDHQEFLGTTVAAIAAEKAAVIHAGAQVITLPQDPRAMRVICARAKGVDASLWPVMRMTKFKTGLLGDHQRWNAAAAVKMAEILCGRLPSQVIRRGVAAADWPGRLEVFHGRPNRILDGAHNPVAVEALIHALKQMRLQGRPVLIFGVTRDKDSVLMLKKLSSYFDQIILSPLSTPRGKTVAELLPEAQRFFAQAIPAGDIREAMKFGRQLAGPQGWIVITGSFYLVGEARSHLNLLL